MKKIYLFLTIFILLGLSTNQVQATKASLLCIPATGTFKVGDTITVDYILDTRSYPTYGGDLVATFDPQILEPLANQSTPITTSTSWGSPITNTVNGSAGNVRLDYGNSQPAFNGRGSLGQVAFKAKAVGQVQFIFPFFGQYDDTTPAGGASKIWGIKTEGAGKTNILTDATNCIYVIEGNLTPTPAPTLPPGTPAPTTPPGTPAPTSPPRPTISVLPRAGVVEDTFSILGLGIIFLFLGLSIPVLAILRDKS